MSLVDAKLDPEHDPKSDPGQAEFRPVAAGPLSDLREGRAPARWRDTMMLFLHGRYGDDPRMPLLQHLLNELGHRGAVHALRIETRRDMTDALRFLVALQRHVGEVLVLFDGVAASLRQGLGGEAPRNAGQPRRDYLLLGAAPRPLDAMSQPSRPLLAPQSVAQLAPQLVPGNLE